jgi:hypothetical protein
VTSRPPFLDQRLGKGCAYCGGPGGTSDHVPSKVFLSEPVPANLPAVDSCPGCNQGFSLDEEYLACFLECVLTGSTKPEAINRDAIRRAIGSKPALRARIEASRQQTGNDPPTWLPDGNRVRNVLLKLARGHVAYELSEYRLDEPSDYWAVPLSSMSPNARADFERAGSGEQRGWPEVGSRAFLRAVGEPAYTDEQGPWVHVQPGRYRYTVDGHTGVTVRLVLAEYLASEATWAD